jgi:hypothetical protein
VPRGGRDPVTPVTSAVAENCQLRSPSTDLAQLTDQLGCAWGVSSGESLPQYLAWCDAAGLFQLLAAGAPLSPADLSAGTILNDQGVEALLPILASLKLVCREPTGGYHLSRLGSEYLVRESPYYVGAGLYWDHDKPIPHAYLKNGGALSPNPQRRPRWPGALRLEIPHSRNFAPTVVAARTGEFDGLTHLVDIGGGSGVLAIPLVSDYPHLRFTLVEMPDVVDRVRANLSRFHVEHRIDVVGMDVFGGDWTFDGCDGVFFGNFLHAHGDEGCSVLLRKAHAALSSSGRIWIHEVLFDEDRNGPLLAALWNANVIARTPGARQRTATELIALLTDAGFQQCHVLPTAGRFSLIGANKSS